MTTDTSEKGLEPPNALAAAKAAGSGWRAAAPVESGGLIVEAVAD